MSSISGHCISDLAAFGSPVDVLFDLCRKKVLTASEIEAVLSTGAVPPNRVRVGSTTGLVSRLRMPAPKE